MKSKRKSWIKMPYGATHKIGFKKRALTQLLPGILFLVLGACASHQKPTDVQPPVAPKKEMVLQKHGDTLTTAEYDEWGNPNDPQYYEYMLSYSPYDNVMEKNYPHILVTSGLHDAAVQYWEPAKWVARLRENNQADTRILLNTNMEAGHGGASGRFRRLHEIALQYAFLL